MSKVSGKKKNITLAVNFFFQATEKFRMSHVSVNFLPILQIMKCKVYATPVLRSVKKNKSKKENADELFATISKRNKLVDYMYMCSYGFWLKC